MSSSSSISALFPTLRPSSPWSIQPLPTPRLFLLHLLYHFLLLFGLLLRDLFAQDVLLVKPLENWLVGPLALGQDSRDLIYLRLLFALGVLNL